MTTQQQEWIKEGINQKYAHLENLLQNNVPGSESPSSDFIRMKSDTSDLFARASN